MVRVCHITSAHNSDDTRIFYKECSSLAAAGYDTYLVAQGESREENGVHIVGVGQVPGNRLKRMTSFAKKVYEKALSLDCDIYHLHDPELLPYGLKLKNRGKKVIFDSHENTVAQIAAKGYIPKFIRTVLSAVYKSYETSVVRRIDAVIVPCTFDGKNIFDGRAKQTAFIANYPRLSDFYSKYSEVPIEKKYDVCYVGGLTYDRGIEHLIKATDMAGAKLVLAGKFSSESFGERMTALPEYRCVDFLGSIPNDEVYTVLQKTRIGAHTLLDVGQYHHADTFGIKVFEYLSLGLPVIVPDYPYVRNMVRQYGFGVCVKTDSIDEIAEVISLLKSHPEEARQMGENGRRAVKEEFNWGTQEKKLLELYSLL